MGTTTYSEKLKSPKWQQRRLKVMERDGWKCVLCGDKEETLHVHHRKYTGEPWDAPDEDLETLCESCHKQTESYKHYDYRIIYRQVLMRPGFKVYVTSCDNGAVYFESIAKGEPIEYLFAMITDNFFKLAENVKRNG